MSWDPTDDDAMLRAGRWASGSPASTAPEADRARDLEALEPQPVDLEPVDLEPIDLTPVADDGDGPSPRAGAGNLMRAITLATVLVVVAGVAGFVVTMLVLDRRDTPVDAAADGLVLDRLIAHQSDLDGDYLVLMQSDGTDAVNTPTLDLCNGNYPTEGSRVARRQVAVVDLDGSSKLGTEAVTYRDAKTSARAFEEVKRVASSCPRTPVPNASGSASYTTLFNAPPDGAWPVTRGVERLAYDIDQVYSDGTSQRSVVVYLRRGHALMGLYFASRGRQPSVQGETEIEGIVTEFAKRLARIPASVAGSASG